MLTLRPMTPADIEFGQRLRAQAGWNQTQADWTRFLGLQPDGGFVAEWNGSPAGTTTTFVMGDVGWIAMVLVEKSLRHRGIGTQLVEHALRFLDSRNVRTVRLDATAFGRPVYERLGFVADYELARYEGVLRSAAMTIPTRSIDSADMPEVAALDRDCTGTDRTSLLSCLRSEFPELATCVTTKGQVVAFLLGRRGTNALQVGPVIATETVHGRWLLDHAAHFAAEQRVFIDVPLSHTEANAWCREQGLATQRTFVRMYRGQPVSERPSWLWASSGPEKG